jgi:hypothetical protein
MNALLSKSQRACLAAESLPPPSEKAKLPTIVLKDAGAAFGVSRSLVNRARRVMGLDPEMYQRVKQGEVTLEVAVRLHASKRRLDGSRPSKRQPLDMRLERIRELVAQGYRSAQIAHELGITDARVRDLARVGGITLYDAVIGRVPVVRAERAVEATVTGLSDYVSGLVMLNGYALNIEPATAREWAHSLGRSLAVLNRLRRHLWRVSHGNQ